MGQMPQILSTLFTDRPLAFVIDPSREANESSQSKLLNKGGPPYQDSFQMGSNSWLHKL